NYDKVKVTGGKT
nr:enterotoxin C-1 - Staphylococcus aureus (fragments) [Staphylococcus aureus]